MMKASASPAVTQGWRRRSGFVADTLRTADEALAFIHEGDRESRLQARRRRDAGAGPGFDEFFKKGKYELEGEGQVARCRRHGRLLRRSGERYPIVSIEDGMAEDDMAGLEKADDKLGKKIQLVGDDLFVTNPKRLADGIKAGIATPSW